MESGYQFLNLIHPLILTLTKNNHFNISYFSSVVCNRLGYFQYELKNKDFHDKLFPGIRFIKQHELLLKHFLFFDSNLYVNKDGFIKTKEGYLQGIKLSAKKFPTFYDDFFLIIGIDFNDGLFLSEINKSFNRYTFLLDENLDFISQTKNFFDNFKFNTHMFKEIKTNFFEFFCVNKNLFNEKLKKINSDFFKINSVNNINNLKKEDDPFALFKSISYEKAYKLRDISKLESLRNDHIIIKGKISKNKILKMIPEFSKLIEEYGLDFEWYQHMEKLRERLSIKEIKNDQDNLTEYSNKMISLGLNSSNIKSFKNSILSNNSLININLINQNKNKENIYFNNIISNNNFVNNNESLRRQSSSNNSLMNRKNNNINNNENDVKVIIENNNNIKICLDRNFDVIFNLKKLGTIYFYIVDLYERTLYKKYDHDSLIHESKYKYSFSKNKSYKQESFKLIDNYKEEEIKFIKAKTLFSNESKNNKNFLIKYKKTFVEENSLIEDDDKVIKKLKTWASENNNINMQKHMIKEGERIFNNRNILIDIKNDKISANSEEYDNNRNKPIKKNKNNLKRQTKKEKTRRIIKDKIENKINYNRINSSINKDEEENILFINKDNLEEYIKKRNTFNFYYIFIIFILFIIIICIISIKLALSIFNFSFTSYLSNGMIYLEEIKTDIYTGSIITLSQCFRNQINEIPIGSSSLPFQLQLKSNDIMMNLNSFEKQLKLSKNYKLLSNIMNYLYKNITIFRLNPDWTMKNQQSYLLKEINYFSYLLNEESSQMEQNIICNFESNFYLYFLNFEEYLQNDSKTFFFINNKEEASFNQHLLYYIVINVIYIINPVLYNILEEIAKVQVQIMNKYLKEIIIINIILIFLIILEEMFILLKNFLDINFIKLNFLFLYEYDQNQIQFEQEISYLELTAKEFNINNLIKLENIKKLNHNYSSNYNINNPNEIIFNNINNENHYKSNFRETLVKNEFEDNKENKKSNLIKNMINQYQKIGNEFDQNSINGSILNNSMNNSMTQLLNKNSKDGVNKLKFDNNKINNKINHIQNNKKNKINNINVNDEDILFKGNEESFELLKKNNKIIPSSIIISIILSIIFFLFFILTILLNLFDIYKKRDIWEYAINLSMNYLEKIPKIIELGLSTYILIIFGSNNLINYYTKEEYPQYQVNYLRYFTNMKNYENSELISSNIKDSLFANKLYDNYRLKKNIEFCESDDFFKNYFKYSKILNQNLNKQHFYCINACLESLAFFNRNIDSLYTYIEFVDQMAITCKDENEKINDSGIDLEINFILHELTFLYIDYEERIKTNATYAREKFFENENFYRILRDMNVPFTYAAGSLCVSINKDLNQLNMGIANHEMIFIIITYIIDALFLCFLLIMVFCNEKYKNLIVFIVKIVKKE